MLCLLMLILLVCTSLEISEKIYPVDDYYTYNKEEKACLSHDTTQSEFENEFESQPCIHFFGHMKFFEEAHYIYNKIQDIEKITGCLTIYRSNLVHANFSKLREIEHDENFCDTNYALRIIGNHKLLSITFHDDFKVQPNKTFMSSNYVLDRNLSTLRDSMFDFGRTTDCLQEEVASRKDCRRIVGDVTYEDYLSEVFRRFPHIEIHGMLIFEDREDVDLSALQNVTVIGHGTPAVSIINNANLVDVSDLLSMKISGKEPLLEILDNDKICAPAEVRSKVRKLAQADVPFDRSCLESCEGGFVDQRFLREFNKSKNCRIIIGDLVIIGLSKALPGLDQLNRIERIEHGSLVFQHNIGFKSIWFLNNLEEIWHPQSRVPVLQIANNYGMESIGLPALRTVKAADPDRAIEIFTYDEVTQVEKKRFKTIALKRDVFNTGHKPIKKERRIYETYENNALLGLVAAAAFGLIMATFAFLVLFTILAKRRRKNVSQERLLMESQALICRNSGQTSVTRSVSST
ncbi:unnamed protein product [Cylicocyclus nassatus]|uniref:Receptor L-domain domain-containing protein n=1 Tax=Cylicocyclus nassatus TaxID=53992 RepID=A0AA36DJ15_CYLNA|nr:unnamed protein product [Cylicocyclus nassatus]